MSKNNDKTIQDKIDDLDKLVAWFDGDDFQLEQASEKLKQAAALATEIENDLQSIANDIQIVKQSFASESGK